MKVLLLKDVYKLGRAGDVKKVADGYGRNYLIPHGMAVLATAGALKQAERIRSKAAVQREILNKEMGAIAERIEGVVLTFAAKASETGKLYGSITTQMLADAILKKTDVEINRRQIDSQPIRTLGEFKVRIRLTVDLMPDIKVIVHREGEAVETAGTAAQAEGTAQAAPVAAQAVAEETVAEGTAQVESTAETVEVAAEAEETVQAEDAAQTEDAT